jgi:hypothetical protein
MQQPNRTNASIGVAFFFMSLALVPFSLRAVGVNVDVRLTAVSDTLKQISGVIATSYNAPLVDLLTPEEKPAEPLHQSECPKLFASAHRCEGESAESAELIPPGTIDRDIVQTQARQERQASRGHARREMTLRVELPVRIRALADVFQLKPSVASMPVAIPRIAIDATPLSLVRLVRNELTTAVGLQREAQRRLNLLLRLGSEPRRSEEIRSTCRITVQARRSDCLRQVADFL